MAHSTNVNLRGRRSLGLCVCSKDFNSVSKVCATPVGTKTVQACTICERSHCRCGCGLSGLRALLLSHPLSSLGSACSKRYTFKSFGESSGRAVCRDCNPNLMAQVRPMLAWVCTSADSATRRPDDQLALAQPIHRLCLPGPERSHRERQDGVPMLQGQV